MALADGVSFTAAAVGTVTFAFGVERSSYLTLSQAVAAGELTDGQQVSYVAQDSLSSPTQREWGHGTFHSAGSGTIVRTTVLGNSLGTTALINFFTRPIVSLTVLAEDIGSAVSGWEQTTGTPGITQTTPINAPGGSGQAGPNVVMAPGNGDGAGNAGNVVLELAAGVQAIGPAGVPSSGVVVLDAANQGNFFFFVQPATTGGTGQSLSFNAGVSNQQGGELDLTAGNSTGAFQGGALNLTAGSSHGGIGGNILLQAGEDSLFLSKGGGFNAIAAAGLQGGDCTFFGGDGHNGGGGKVQFTSGPDLGVNGAGGAITFETGQGSGFGNGGDLTLTWGVSTGAGRSGLFFPHLPTTDPGVSGAAWCDITDGNRVKISA